MILREATTILTLAKKSGADLSYSISR